MHNRNATLRRCIPLLVGGIALLIAACTPQEAEPGILELDNYIVITATVPTMTPTLVPTFALVTPSPTPTLTPSVTPDLSSGPEGAAQPDVSCDVVVQALYETAGDLCLGKPSGFFCNGGLPPRVEPAGPVANSLASPGAVVEVDVIDSVHTPPLPSNNSGGVTWLRLGEFVQMSALLVGDVQLRDVTPPNSDFPAWQSLTVQTSDDREACQTAPYSSFIVQSPIGESSSMVINGTSVDLDGTLVVQTLEEQTLFMLLEGLVRVVVFGQAYPVFPGQQLIVAHSGGDFTRPAAIPSEPTPFDFGRVQHLPVPLFERPVLLPQAGYVYTEGTVNMRAGPDINSQLIYSVPSGQVISVLGQNLDQDWFHVRLGNGETGWMRADLLTQRLGTIQLSYDETPQPPQRFGDLGRVASVSTAQGGNLRRAPDVSFPIVATLPFGTEVTLIARSPYSPWVKVDAAGVSGWMSLLTIETQSAISFLPVEYNVPPPPRPTATPDFAGGHAYPDPAGGY